MSSVQPLHRLTDRLPRPADTDTITLPLLLEAEEGGLRHVGLEATRGNFSGWGYLAGWDSAGQGVSFPLPSWGEFEAAGAAMRSYARRHCRVHSVFIAHLMFAKRFSCPGVLVSGQRQRQTV